MDWFLYDISLRHKRVKWLILAVKLPKSYYIKTKNLQVHLKAFQNLRLKFLCDAIFLLLADKSHFFGFPKQILSQMYTPGNQTFQIRINWNEKLLSTSQELLQKVN